MMILGYVIAVVVAFAGGVVVTFLFGRKAVNAANEALAAAVAEKNAVLAAIAAKIAPK